MKKEIKGFLKPDIRKIIWTVIFFMFGFSILSLRYFCTISSIGGPNLPHILDQYIIPLFFPISCLLGQEIEAQIMVFITQIPYWGALAFLLVFAYDRFMDREKPKSHTVKHPSEEGGVVPEEGGVVPE